MPLGMEVGLSPGGTVRRGPSSPTERGTAASRHFRPTLFALARSPVSATAHLLFTLTGSSVFAAALDMSKAFDMVCHSNLFKSLIKVKLK